MSFSEFLFLRPDPRLSSYTMPPKSRKKRLNDEKATVAREGKKAKGDEPALEQQAIAQTHSASTETTPPAVDPEESDRSGATTLKKRLQAAQPIISLFSLSSIQYQELAVYIHYFSSRVHWHHAW